MKELEKLLAENSKILEERNKSNNKNAENSENLSNAENSDNSANSENPQDTAGTTKVQNLSDAEIAEKIKLMPVVGVGDSVLLGASEGLYKVFPNGYFDGKVSRSMIGGEEVLQKLKDEGKLGNVVILALANNSDYFEWRIDRIMNVVGDRQIYWITAVLADDPQFNEKFRGYASKHPNIHIVEWEEKSKSHPEYFYGDGIHLKGDGIDAYANTIYEAIFNDYKNGVINN